VESFKRNGQEVPALVTDSTRWRKVVVQSQTVFNIKMMDDSIANIGTAYGDPGTMTLAPGVDKNVRYPFAWSRLDADHLLLEGQLASGPLSVRLRKIDTSKFRLLGTGYHWINEFPVNR
jgi:hypothetical protein